MPTVNDLIVAKTFARVSSIVGALLVEAGVEQNAVAGMFEAATIAAVKGNKELEDRVYVVLNEVTQERIAEFEGRASSVFKHEDAQSTARHENWD